MSLRQNTHRPGWDCNSNANKHKNHRQSNKPDCKSNNCPKSHVIYDEKEEEQKEVSKLKEVDRALIKCNGDCGAQIAKLMDHCVKYKNIQTFPDYENIIINSFRNHLDPLRKLLIILIRKNNCTEKYKQHIFNLRNVDYFIQYKSQINDIGNLFKQMVECGDKDILHELANESCKFGVRSLLEEIRQGQLSRIHDLQKKYDALQQTLSIYQQCKTKDMKILLWIANQMNELKAQIKTEKDKINQNSNIDQYFKRLDEIKNTQKYKKMQRRNTALNDLEILAILFYCDEDQYCYKMRKSHRDKELNSCEWKNLYYHLCSGINKIYRVFHHQNKQWIKCRKMFDLFSGSTICDLINENKTCLHLQTVTSFSTSWIVAKGFAERFKQHKDEKNGMILVINDGIKALYEGRLRGADVSWISKFSKEDEYIILPTTFKNFSYVSETNRTDRGWIITDDYNMYITDDVESTNISYATKDIRSQIDALAAWMPAGSQFYETMLPIVEHIIHIFMIILGSFYFLECPVCGVNSRLCDYRGNFTNLSKECPSCRSYIFQHGATNTDHDRKFSCNNPECEPKYGEITRCDLKQIDKSSILNPNHGYQCIKCKKQQKIAYHTALTSDESTINAKINSILKSVDKIIEKYNILTNDKSHNVKNEFTTEDKKQLAEIIKFMHMKKNWNPKIETDFKFYDLLKRYPIIWKWIASIKYIRMCLDAYKDGYMKLIDSGLVSESTEFIFNEQVGEIITETLKRKVENYNKHGIEFSTPDMIKGMVGMWAGMHKAATNDDSD